MPVDARCTLIMRSQSKPGHEALTTSNHINEPGFKLQGLLRQDGGILWGDDGRLHSVPAGPLVNESCQQGVIKGVTRFMGHDMANDGHAKEGEVSNAVEYLMADKFVFKS